MTVKSELCNPFGKYPLLNDVQGQVLKCNYFGSMIDCIHDITKLSGEYRNFGHLNFLWLEVHNTIIHFVDKPFQHG